MGDHPYLCDCSQCEYERILNRVREMQAKYHMQEEQQFLYGDMKDPFPPKDDYYEAKKERFKQAYSNKPKHQGHYRRIQDKALDVINFQYQPWAGHEWVTYHTVTFESLVTAPNAKRFGILAVKNADLALQEKRFYKIERVH